MIKFIVVIYRRPDFDEATIRDYFRAVHAPLVETLPGLAKYLLNWPTVIEGHPPAKWDLAVELYFESMAAMERAWASEAGERATDDLVEFADLDRTSWAVVDVEQRR